MEQLYELYDEILLESLFINANDEIFWINSNDEDKYKAYISNYYHFNKNNDDASFGNFIMKIHTKLNNIHNLNTINNITNLVITNQQTWLEGLQNLYSLEDLEIYGW